MNLFSITICTVLVEKSPQALPLGAACIASYLKAKLPIQCKVNLVDWNLEECPNSNKITQYLKDTESGIFLFSVFVWNRNLLCQIASELKKIVPNCITIAGGPEVTACPESFFCDTFGDSKPFDYVISGEGEIESEKLIQNLISGNRPETKIFYGKRALLAELPSPYLDGTLDATKYEGALWELARGCPYKCSYCYESKGEKK